MITQPNQTVVTTFRIENDEQQLVNADSAPNGKLFVNGVEDTNVFVLISNISAGLYSAQWINENYSIGNSWELQINATVDGVNYSRVVRMGYIDAHVNTRADQETADLCKFILANRVVSAPAAGGEVQLSFHNDADSLVRTVQYNPVTGARQVLFP
jgi:hypothetical protein